jgi:hypothetical protein
MDVTGFWLVCQQVVCQPLVSAEWPPPLGSEASFIQPATSCQLQAETGTFLLEDTGLSLEQLLHRVCKQQEQHTHTYTPATSLPASCEAALLVLCGREEAPASQGTPLCLCSHVTGPV